MDATTPVGEDLTRQAAFESWAKKEKLDLWHRVSTRTQEVVYLKSNTRAAWKAWRAALSLIRENP